MIYILRYDEVVGEEEEKTVIAGVGGSQMFIQ